MNPQATITAVDSPSKYWYTATTSYGQQSKGVRLYGTGSKFRVGESVDVFQCGEEYGYAEIPLQYKSQLTIPDAMKAEVARQAPASVALAYIAKLAGNNKVYYVPGTVVSIIDAFYMMVSSTLSTSPLRLMCVINTSAFYVGARVLIMAHPLKTPQVIGWWNCLPRGGEDEDDKPEWWTDEDEEAWEDAWWNDPQYGLNLSRKRRYVFVIGRIPFTADIDFRIIDDNFETVKINIFGSRDPASNIAFVTTYPTTEEDDFFYCKVMMGINYGAILERYWLKVNKKTFSIFEMSESAFPPHPGVAWSTIIYPGWGWFGATASDTMCYIENPPGDAPTRINVFYAGPTNDAWFPLQNFRYLRGTLP